MSSQFAFRLYSFVACFMCVACCPFWCSSPSVIWPSMSVPGEGGNITDVMFDGAVFYGTNQASSLQAHKLTQIYTNTDYCLIAACTWFLTTRRWE
jgi:hypothetical protein